MQTVAAAGRRVLVGPVDDLPDGAAVVLAREITATADDIAVFNDAGQFYAINDTCTHGQASLVDGWVEDGVVECPMHNGGFCLRTGTAVARPAVEDTIVHRVDIVDGVVWLLPTDSAPGPTG